jgi:peptide/nickel transport system permease protein
MLHNPALRMVGSRLGAALPGLAGVVIVTFLLTRALPGDPAAFFAGPAASQQAVDEVRARLGLDRSLATQFLYYLRDLSRLDLGKSLTTGQPVGRDLVPGCLPRSA